MRKPGETCPSGGHDRGENKPQLLERLLIANRGVQLVCRAHNYRKIARNSDLHKWLSD
jgi:hypothetical protein